MRIQTLHLSWFRGAGSSAVLEPKGKSLVCFGPNGAGKSTFVDALEYLASDGKIEHLSHEYSGKSQINGVRNTHAPGTSPATIEVALAGGATIRASISPKGAVQIDGSSEAAGAALESWRVSQLVLRQDEVARFINARKGDKYSALLPILGLADLETIAENLRKLAKEVQKQGRVAEVEAQVTAAAAEGGLDLARDTLSRLAGKYGVVPEALLTTIEAKLATVDEDSRRRRNLEAAQDLQLSAKARDALAVATRVAEGFRQVVHGRVQALEGARDVLTGSPESETVDCPSCGRSIARDTLAEHVAAEYPPPPRSIMRGTKVCRPLSTP
jgi:energy-coupling factor transporter ATP-binding protein EcfA2